MDNKPPKDHEFGFRHLIGPLLLTFVAVPTGCGALTAAISKRATFMDGFYLGCGVLFMGLALAVGSMIRGRKN